MSIYSCAFCGIIIEQLARELLHVSRIEAKGCCCHLASPGKSYNRTIIGIKDFQMQQFGVNPPWTEKLSI